MKVLALNGSPRKTWNTATLINKAIEGAASKGAETELIHLYDLNFKGCVSCNACKLRDGKSLGKCAQKDDLAPVLAQMGEIDALILGSPVYFGRVTSGMRAFLERLFFPFYKYVDPWESIAPKKLRAGIMYTFNITEEEYRTVCRDKYCLDFNEDLLELLFGSVESLYCFDTTQFEDHSKVVADRIDVAAKEKTRKEVFPKTCQKAYEIGARFAVEGDKQPYL